MPLSRRAALGWAAAMAVLVLLLTLWPLPEQAYRASLSPVTCLVCGDQGMQDVIQNILMLMPLGLALGLAGIRPARAMLLGFLLSLTVESLQYWVVTGRDASLSDLLTNTLGTFLGATLSRHLPTFLRPGVRASRRLAVAAAGAFAALWAFGAWAIGNDTGAGHWRGRFPGDLPDAPALNGVAHAASITGATLSIVPRNLPPVVEQEFEAGRFRVETAVEVGPPVAWRENVITVIDVDSARGTANNNLVFVLNRVTQRALLAFRINGAAVRLRTPNYDFGHMFGAPGAGRVEIVLERDGGLLRGTSRSPTDTISTSFRLGPEMLYSVLFPRSPRPGGLWHFESLLWAALMLGAAGYWAGRAGRGAVVGVLLLAVATQLLVPHLFPVAPQSILGWVLLQGGLLLGALLTTHDSRLTSD